MLQKAFAISVNSDSVARIRFATEAIDDGAAQSRSGDQGQFFYSFRLEEAVPDDHPIRDIAAVQLLSARRMPERPRSDLLCLVFRFLDLLLKELFLRSLQRDQLDR